MADEVFVNIPDTDAYSPGSPRTMDAGADGGPSLSVGRRRDPGSDHNPSEASDSQSSQFGGTLGDSNTVRLDFGAPLVPGGPAGPLSEREDKVLRSWIVRYPMEDEGSRPSVVNRLVSAAGLLIVVAFTFVASSLTDAQFPLSTYFILGGLIVFGAVLAVSGFCLEDARKDRQEKRRHEWYMRQLDRYLDAPDWPNLADSRSASTQNDLG